MSANKTVYEITLPDDLANKLLALRQQQPDLFEGVSILFAESDGDTAEKVRITIDLDRQELQQTDILTRLLAAVGDRKIQLEALHK